MAEEYIKKSRLIESIRKHAAKVGTTIEPYQLAHEHIIDIVEIQPALDVCEYVGTLVAKVCKSIKCAYCPFCNAGSRCSFADINGNIPSYTEWDAESGLQGADNGKE